MQKTIAHKFFSLTLAFLVLVSAFSFKIETHFCGSKIVDVAVFSSVKSCCSATPSLGSEFQFTKNSYCKNKVLSVKGLKHYKIVSLSIELPVVNVFLEPSKFYIEPLFFDFSDSDYYSSYSPPDLVIDFLVDHQIFLI